MYSRAIVALAVACIIYPEAIKSESEVPKLPIAVYYESLCPDSVRFITKQLYPVWREFGQLLDIHFVPFGKSSSLNNGEKFVCQHGPKECTGNKLQSCALSLTSDQIQQVEFVNCFMSPGPTAEQCSSKIGLTWSEVEACFYSPAGIQLQLNAETETLPISPKFVPTIIYNGIFNQQEQDKSQYDFRGVVCSYLEKVTPEICK